MNFFTIIQTTLNYFQLAWMKELSPIWLIRQIFTANKNEFIEIGEIEKYLRLFKLACLLHDLGHAPFSHTGEEFYLEMNVLVALSDHKDLFQNSEEKSFFARCIIIRYRIY